MSEYKLTEVKFSYYEDQTLPTQAGQKESEIKCYIVAHGIYEYLGEAGVVDQQIYLVATKNINASGNIAVTANTAPFPTAESIINTLNGLIEEKITSNNNERYYVHLRREALAKAQTLEGLPTRYTPPFPGISNL